MAGTGLILLIAAVVVIIVISRLSRTDDNYEKVLNKTEGMDEDLSYSFGFPTHQDYGMPVLPPYYNYNYGYGHGYSQNVGYWNTPYDFPQGYGPGAWYTPKSIRQQEKRMRQKEKSLWTGRCYDTHQHDGCLGGYRNRGIDDDKDGKDDRWECCRRQ